VSHLRCLNVDHCLVPPWCHSLYAIKSFFYLISRPISKGKDSCKLIAPDKPISYSTTREAFRRDLKTIGADPSKFGLHSQRSGGATMVANNGVSESVSATRSLEVGLSQRHIC